MQLTSLLSLSLLVLAATSTLAAPNGESRDAIDRLDRKKDSTKFEMRSLVYRRVIVKKARKLLVKDIEVCLNNPETRKSGLMENRLPDENLFYNKCFEIIRSTIRSPDLDKFSRGLRKAHITFKSVATVSSAYGALKELAGEYPSEVLDFFGRERRRRNKDFLKLEEALKILSTIREGTPSNAITHLVTSVRSMFVALLEKIRDDVKSKKQDDDVLEWFNSKIDKDIRTLQRWTETKLEDNRKKK